MSKKLPKIPHPPIQGGAAAARRRLAELLIVLRSPDPPGAFSAIAEDQNLVSKLIEWPGKKPEELWGELVERIQSLAEAQRCLRCGTCCRVSSPTLYKDDLNAVLEGKIPKNRLFTLRMGEVVHSSRLKEKLNLDQELIKMKERPQGGCMMLDDHLCSEYNHRPLQCRHLECWSGRHAGDLEDKPRLRRKDLYAEDSTALALMDEYEIKVPVANLIGDLESGSRGDDEATMRALELIALDSRLRGAIAEKYGYSLNEQELLFGRGAEAIACGLGYSINVDDEDTPRIVSRPKSAREN